jgi:hypothetical protein
MDKYELYAVGHYFSEWPENMSFDDFMNALATDDNIQDCWPVVQYEGIPNEDMAYLIKDMVEGLRRVF